jgi:hypothetical protein
MTGNLRHKSAGSTLGVDGIAGVFSAAVGVVVIRRAAVGGTRVSTGVGVGLTGLNPTDGTNVGDEAGAQAASKSNRQPRPAAVFMENWPFSRMAGGI